MVVSYLLESLDRVINEVSKGSLVPQKTYIVSYVDLDGKGSKKKVKIIKIDAGKGYVYVYDHKAKKLKTFRLSGIKKVKLYKE